MLPRYVLRLEGSILLGVSPVLKLAQYSMSKALAKGDHADANNKRRPADGAFLPRGNMLIIMSLVED